VAEVQKFKFHMKRAKRTTSWGVDFQSHSGCSLTIVALGPGQAIVESNTWARLYAAQPLKPGDVIVSIDGATTQAEMVEKLKEETSLTADIVRYSKFEAVIERSVTADFKESFGMNIVQTHGNHLSIDKIDTKSSPVKRYNDQNYVKPLIRGDVIVAVDSITTPDEMIQRIQAGPKVTLSIERHQRFGQKLPPAPPAPTIQRPVDSVREIAEAA
jgi:C-terminal processing protease CtpA/Prc